MLKAKDIYLSPIIKKDYDQLFDWINDRNLVIYNNNYKPISELEHEEWFNHLVRKRDSIIFSIRKNLTAEIIGTCQLTSIRYIDRNAELQIRIGSLKNRGQGFGTQSVKLLLKFGFNDLNLEKIYLTVFSDNDNAIKSYLKCGLRNEGVLRRHAFIDGVYKDLNMMSILRNEFYEQ